MGLDACRTVVVMRELACFPLAERYAVTSPYGYRVDPITGAVGDFHRGIDYGAPHGSPVLAPFDGQVTAGYESGAGNWCWVVNGPDMFKSFHHASHAVDGGWVTAGTVVAYIGSTGSSTGAHAHLELWDSGVNIDPTGYLDRAPLFGEEGDWFDMATKEELEAVVRDVVMDMLTSNLVWDDGDALWEVLVRGDGSRIRRRIVSPKELDLLVLGQELRRCRTIDLRNADPHTLAAWNSWPKVEQELVSGAYD